MTTIDMDRRFGPGSDRGFFIVMAVVVALVVAAGFGPSYAASLPPPGLPFWVHLHGAAMTAWIILFGVQAWLIGQRNLRLHKTLGWLSISLVLAIIPLGFATNLLAIQRGAVPPFFRPVDMMAADLLDVSLFAGLFASAVLMRRKAAWHKRLMLCATILLTWPAVARLIPLRALGLSQIIPASITIVIALALIGPLYDLATRRRIHPAYFWGVGAIVISHPLHALIASQPAVQAWANRLTG
ncbi:hypothetical protein [Caulobacter segnis]|uniref:Uncharacterized protein n=1 Tax=Caulobacter segnis TaxID=88688 RepID=A0A2W5UWI5_9CAUL|nr:hypothetical protein [Caulobacter segnis]PZR32109.1 MAG: hypothetical protein DI526_17510 [Caulobacter segnis]